MTTRAKINARWPSISFAADQHTRGMEAGPLGEIRHFFRISTSEFTIPVIIVLPRVIFGLRVSPWSNQVKKARLKSMAEGAQE